MWKGQACVVGLHGEINTTGRLSVHVYLLAGFP